MVVEDAREVIFMYDININTDLMNDYARRLRNVNTAICELDNHIHSLYLKVGWSDLWNLFQADLSTGWSWKLERCATYLDDTANAFWNLEQRLHKYCPIKFDKRAKAGIDEIIWNCIDGFTRDDFVWARTLFKGIKGALQLAVSAPVIATPHGAASVLSGLNDVVSSFFDMADYGRGRYDHIGKNDIFKNFGDNTIGLLFDNEESTGKEIGGKIFTVGIDIISLIGGCDSFALSLDKIASYTPDLTKSNFSNFLKLEKISYNAIQAGNSYATDITDVSTSVLSLFNIDLSKPEEKSALKDFYDGLVGPAISIIKKVEKFKAF